MVWHAGGWWWNPFLLGLAVEVAAYLLVRPRLRVLCERGYQVGLEPDGWPSRHSAGLLTRAPGRVTCCAASAPRCVSRRARCTGSSPLRLGLLLQLPVAYFFAVQLVPWLETRLLARVARLPAAWESIGTMRGPGRLRRAGV